MRWAIDGPMPRTVRSSSGDAVFAFTAASADAGARHASSMQSSVERSIRVGLIVDSRIEASGTRDDCSGALRADQAAPRS